MHWHTKTVTRQSQDKTWLCRDWAKTETCKYVARDVSRRDMCLETPSPLVLIKLIIHANRHFVVSESRVTWATSVPILVFVGLSVLDLGPMYASDRQTSDKLTISSHLFARWHLFRYVGYLRHQQQVDLWPWKVKVHTLDIAPLRSESPPQKRSDMARVLKGFHSFTCTPTRSSAIGMSHTAFAFPAITGTHLPIPDGWKAE